jgi:hypothetical protein
LPEFDVALQYIVIATLAVAVLLGGGFGFKRLLRRPPIDRDVAERLAGIEARMGEVEERLDFSERLLTELRSRAQIPPKP